METLLLSIYGLMAFNWRACRAIELVKQNVNNGSRIERKAKKSLFATMQQPTRQQPNGKILRAQANASNVFY